MDVMRLRIQSYVTRQLFVFSPLRLDMWPLLLLSSHWLLYWHSDSDVINLGRVRVEFWSSEILVSGLLWRRHLRLVTELVLADKVVSVGILGGSLILLDRICVTIGWIVVIIGLLSLALEHFPFSCICGYFLAGDHVLRVVITARCASSDLLFAFFFGINHSHTLRR